MKVVGNKLMAVCRDCGKTICVNKTLFGSLHLCTTDDERRQYSSEIKRRAESAEFQLRNAK